MAEHSSDIYGLKVSKNTIVLLSFIASYSLDYHYLTCVFAILLIVMLFVSAYLSTRVLKLGGSMHCKWHSYIFTLIYAVFKFESLEALFRYSTYKYRKYPDIYIIGVTKCGTTTMAHHLKQTFGLNPPFSCIINPVTTNKETAYFALLYHCKYLKKFVEPEYYSMCFDFKFSKALTFDATPTYLSNGFVRNRIHRATPNAKFIIMVRNPIKRMISYVSSENKLSLTGNKMGICRKWNTKTLQQFIDCGTTQYFAQEMQKLQSLQYDDLLPDSCYFIRYHSAVHEGFYYKNIQFWYELFDEAQFLILDLETDLNSVETLKDTMKKVSNFIGIKEAENIKAIVSNQRQQVVHSAPKHVHDFKKSVAELIEIYREPNLMFFNMISRDLGWNDLCVDDYL